ncbi:MAG: hypothetical protein NTW51_15600 [Cyanobacteria bacterium]|nr:hypothetical protein [Cyanobacteriota bacterium]
MKNTLPRLVQTATGLAFAVAIANPAPLHAATVTYLFDVNIDSGSLASNTYSGSFAYDDATADVTAFSFFFDGLQYDESDDVLAEVSQNGPNFLGLIFSVVGIQPNSSFSFVAGSSDINEAYFAYDPNSNSGQAGFGSIVYNMVNPPVTNAVPAPLPFVGAAAFFAYSRKLRKRVYRTPHA